MQKVLNLLAPLTPGSDHECKPGLNYVEWKAQYLPKDFTNKTVLDIGAYQGYYSVLALMRNAKHVLSVDNFYGDFVKIDYYKNICKEHKIENWKYEKSDVYDLDNLQGTYDVVMFYDVFYHIEDPLLILRKVKRKVGKELYLSTLVSEEDEPFMRLHDPYELVKEDPTNVWVPSVSCMIKLLKYVGFSDVKLLDKVRQRAIFYAQ